MVFGIHASLRCSAGRPLRHVANNTARIKITVQTHAAVGVHELADILLVPDVSNRSSFRNSGPILNFTRDTCSPLDYPSCGGFLFYQPPL